jgi:hypothetical protein
VHTTKATILKRYAPDSVRFDQAQPAPIDVIHAGDQLRARGSKNADGTEIAAEEVVSGSFRNISGTISSIDPAASTLVIKDLATKNRSPSALRRCAADAPPCSNGADARHAFERGRVRIWRGIQCARPRRGFGRSRSTRACRSLGATRIRCSATT